MFKGGLDYVEIYDIHPRYAVILPRDKMSRFTNDTSRVFELKYVQAANKMSNLLHFMISLG